MIRMKYTSVPDNLPLYHPLSELKDKSGCYPNITNDQLIAVNELLSLLEKDEMLHQFNHDNEIEFFKLLRFLRARKFNIQASYKMIVEDIKWRNEENRLFLQKETAEMVLGCDLSKVFTYFPTWISGFDKQLRPVAYRKFGKFEIWNILKLTTMNQLIRFHAWETEMALNRMYKYTKQHHYNIETFLLVIDAAGWNLSLATSDAFTFIKGMAVTDSAHYPERLGTLLVINAPSVLAISWRVIQEFLDPVTKEKIQIYSTNRAKWEPVLRQYVDVDQLPVQYGGTVPDPSPEEALQSMNPVVDDEGKDEEREESESSFDKRSSAEYDTSSCSTGFVKDEGIDAGTQTEDFWNESIEVIGSSTPASCILC
jgi:hypothetical protein